MPVAARSCNACAICFCPRISRGYSALLRASAATEMSWVNGEHMPTTDAVTLGLQARVFTDLSRHSNVLISPVFYDTTNILNRHSLVIDQGFARFLDAVDKNHTLLTKEPDVLNEFRQKLCDILASDVILNCLTSKHNAYKSEKEVRLIIVGTGDTSRIRTRLRGSEIVPYIAYDLAVRSPQTILEIVTGPAAGTDAPRTVRTMLSSLKVEDHHKILVNPSEIPYRAL